MKTFMLNGSPHQSGNASISEVPAASGRYWNSAHGQMPGEAQQDAVKLPL